jgi:hypothetical protein
LPDHLYRFRSIQALLGCYAELDRQEIYFAATDALNDPMEGYLEVVWRGDSALWANLLKHYLLCLIQSAAVALHSPDFTAEVCKALLRQTRQDVLHLPLADLHKALCDAVLGSPGGAAFVSRVGALNRAVSRGELLFYLRALHPQILTALLRLLADRGLMDQAAAAPPPNLAEVEAGFVEQIDTLATLVRKDGPRTRAAFSTATSAMEQIGLLRAYQFATNGPPQPPGWTFVNREFPAFYVEGLEDLVYPRWRVACFVEAPTNASMWGVYGEAHRGVCLKFRTQAADDRTSLVLDAHFGWASADGGAVRSLRSRRAMTFSPVRYGARRPRIDFFNSLGGLSHERLRDWLFDRDGKVSALARPLYEETEAWRTNYWATYETLQTVKTAEWRHEREHRLTLTTAPGETLDIGQAKARYDFADLAGIVFGARTAEADKVAIMKIVARKCRETGRDDFEFHQARYHEGNKLQIAPLGLLKVDLG